MIMLAGKCDCGGVWGCDTPGVCHDSGTSLSLDRASIVELGLKGAIKVGHHFKDAKSMLMGTGVGAFPDAWFLDEHACMHARAIKGILNFFDFHISLLHLFPCKKLQPHERATLLHESTYS
eukprot:1155292-Pelagomonas_calceolata.AAC.4